VCPPSTLGFCGRGHHVRDRAREQKRVGLSNFIPPMPSSQTPSTASAALWAHLRRPPATYHAPTSSAPITPVDKTGTSMRVLLSDTQVNFERFGERVGRLIDGVEETRLKMDVMKGMCEEERERMGGLVGDLGERS
jgi:hypothetical protein